MSVWNIEVDMFLFLFFKKKKLIIMSNKALKFYKCIIYVLYGYTYEVNDLN